jgi:hypothetical protein
MTRCQFVSFKGAVEGQLTPGKSTVQKGARIKSPKIEPSHLYVAINSVVA